MTSYASGSFLTTWRWGGDPKPAIPEAVKAALTVETVDKRSTRGPKLTEEQKAAFFEALKRSGGNATKAALEVGISGGHGRKLALKAKALEPAASIQEEIDEDMIAAAHAVNELARQKSTPAPLEPPSSPLPTPKVSVMREAVEAAIEEIEKHDSEEDEEEDEEEFERSNSVKEKEMILINRLIKEAEGRRPLRITTKPYAKHFVIPDCQLKPGDDTAFLRRIGQEIVEQLPDAIICLGDFGDMQSLCRQDRNKKSSAGRSYYADCAIVRKGMEALMGPIHEENARRAAAGVPLYEPYKLICLGNHEFRIERERAKVSGPECTFQLSDLGFEEAGWWVYPFLVVVKVDGISYSHYHTSGPMGRPIPSARLILQKKHESCAQGHSQTDQVYSEYSVSGKRLTAVIAGCCYENDLDFLGPQGNNYFRGVHVFNEVKAGEFYPHQISLASLKRKYPQTNPQAPSKAI